MGDDEPGIVQIQGGDRRKNIAQDFSPESRMDPLVTPPSLVLTGMKGIVKGAGLAVVVGKRGPPGEVLRFRHPEKVAWEKAGS